MKRMFAVGVGLLLMGVASTGRAQFSYLTNSDGAGITITGFSGFGAAELPAEINGLPVTRVDNYACEYSEMSSLAIPDSVGSIGAYAFSQDFYLTNIAIGAGVTNIGEGAFDHCPAPGFSVDARNAWYCTVGGVLFDKNLRTLVKYPGGGASSYAVPAGVTRIGASAFAECGQITNLVLPMSLSSVGDSAFWSCSGLGSLCIPGQVAGLGTGSFSYCSSLTGVYFDGNAPTLDGDLFDTNFSGPPATIFYPAGTAGWSASLGGIPTEEWTPSPPDQFEYASNAGGITITMYVGTSQNVSVPATVNGLPVTSIGANAFRGSRVRTLAIPGTVISVGDGAFAFCSNLLSVSFLGSAPALGPTVFAGDSATIYYTGAPGWTIPAGYTGLPAIGPPSLSQFNWTTNADNTLSLSYVGNGQIVVVPARINGLPVTEAYFFSPYQPGGPGAILISEGVQSVNLGFCTSLTNLLIPASVTNLFVPATYPNYGSPNPAWQAINVDPGNSVYSSLDGVLFDKNQTTILAYPPGRNGVYVIPATATSIGSLAFDHCSGLTSVSIPQGVTNIGDAAFYDCESLENVSVAGTVIEIGAEAFMDCYSLRDVTISSGVRSIDSSAFENCGNLSNITIPGSVTNLGEAVFADCVRSDYFTGRTDGLTNIYFDGNAPRYSSNVFDGDLSALRAHFLQGTSGWGPTLGGRPTVGLPARDLMITTEPMSETVLPGDDVRLTVAAFGREPLTCQWYFDGRKLAEQAGTSGVTTDTLRLTNFTARSEAGSYSVVVRNTYGSVTSAVATLSVLTITKQPTNSTVPLGANATFSVGATGEFVGYEWYQNGNWIDDDAEHFSGAYSGSLAIQNVTSNDVGTYSVVLYCTTGEIASSNAVLTLGVETNKPFVAISSPKAGTRSANPVLNGTASDLVRVKGVNYWITNVNNGVRTTSSGQAVLAAARGSSSNWTIQANLLPGTNILAVQSYNYAGLSSLTTNSVFFYRVAAPVQLQVIPAGTGRIAGSAPFRGETPPTNGAPLFVGETYSITANPTANWWLVDWMNGAQLVSTNATFFFTMEPNLVLTAEFATNALVGRAGRYDGIFSPGLPYPVGPSGLIENLVLGNSGLYSGKLYFSATNYALAGSFNLWGEAAETIPRPGNPDGDLALYLAISPTAFPRQITGWVQGTNSGSWFSNDVSLIAATTNRHYLSPYTAYMVESRLQPGPAALPPGSSIPPNCDYMLITNTGSMINYRGMMSDGTAFQRSEPVNEAGGFPVFSSLYGGQGFLLGMVGPLSNSTGRAGELVWSRPEQTNGRYSSGFTTLLDVTLSPWTNSTAALTNLFGHGMQLVLAGGGLAADLGCSLQLTRSNTLRSLGGSTNFLNGFVNPINGMVTISFFDPLGSNVTASGVMLQNIKSGGGFFLDGAGGGTMILSNTLQIRTAVKRGVGE